MNTKKTTIGVFILSLILSLLISPSISIAQDPQPGDTNEPVILDQENPSALVSSSFTYQGRLKNGATPVNGFCDFIWDIYASSTGGTSLETELDTNVPVTNGLFTVVINVSATVIDGNARFLEVQVRCPSGSGDYTLLTPRQELQATPYALGLHLPFNHTTSNVGSAIFSIDNTSSATTYATIQGSSAGGDGVRGLSTGGSSADNGVYGETNSTQTIDAGVKGVSTNYGSFGGYFSNTDVTTSGGALYAEGDAKQSLTGNGFVKVGMYVNCSGTNSYIVRYFNNVSTATITMINGSSVGHCTVDFGFDVSDRYVATMSWGNEPRIITFWTGSEIDRLNFYRHLPDGSGEDGGIMILIY